MSSLIPPPPQDTGRKKEYGNNGFSHFPLALDPLHPNQLCKNHQKIKKKKVNKVKLLPETTKKHYLNYVKEVSCGKWERSAPAE